MDDKSRNIINEAKENENMIEVLVDGEWQPVRWTIDVYDGSPYGCTGFSDENGYHMAEDVFDAAREYNGDVHISSREDIREEESYRW